VSEDGELLGLGTFGHYRLLDLLGRGGMGLVFRAHDTRRRRDVALKLLPEELSSDPALVERFRREAFAAARLVDPHIVPIHDFGEIGSRLFIDMQLVDGRNLAQLLADVGPLDPHRAVHVLRQAAQALDTAHAEQLVHRDVKPSNLIVVEAKDDFTYLLDFGIAHVIGAATTGTSLTSTGSTVGTLAYMAPERFVGPDGIDGRVDVYALACVLFEMLTGTRPFPYDDLPALLNAHLNATPPTVGSRRGGLSPAWDEVVARGMAKDPEQRFRTARELALAARAVLEAPVTVIVTPASPAGDRPPADAPPTPPAMAGAAHPPQPGGLWDMSLPPQVPRVAAPVGGPPPGPMGPPAMATVRTPPPNSIPPAGPPHRPVEPGGPRRSGRRRLWTVVAALAGVVAVVATAVTVVLLNRAGIGGPATPDPGEQLVLQSAGVPGDGAFAPDFRTVTTGLSGTALASSRPDSACCVATTTGSTEQLYRATRGVGDCDRAGLADYLAGRPAQRAAWVAALGADPSMRTTDPAQQGLTTVMTPVLLRADTLVVDHRYVDGAAQPFDAVLQAGTAVLVDEYGVPRVRCISGSPLIVPGSPAVPEPALIGTSWPGFERGAVLRVQAADAPVAQFGLIDTVGAGGFRRPAGSAGEQDFDEVPATASLNGSYLLDGQQTFCDLIDCQNYSSIQLNVVISDCTPQQCAVTVSQWGVTAAPLVLDGDTWRASGPLPADYQHVCGDQPAGTTFRFDVRATEAAVTRTVWSASSVVAFFAAESPLGTCSASRQTFDLTGRRS
jgi:serine/threonine protein kinase